jgi:SAM-dependent methyltransferase
MARRARSPKVDQAGGEDAVVDAARDYDRWFDERWGSYAFAVEAGAIRQAAGPLRGVRVLDAGCGTGRFAASFEAGDGRVVALDADRGMLAVTAGRLTGPCVVGDVAHLPLRTRSVDVAVAVTVLEFVSAPSEVVGELARVTRPGGRIVIGALNPRSLWGLAHRRQLRSGVWCSARFLPRRRLVAFASPYGQVRLHGVLYAPTAFPGLRWIGPLLEAAGRLTPRRGAFQVLVIDRS